MLAAVAGALAALIVVSLVYVRVHSTNPPRSASTPAVQIPRSVLDATHLTAAAALITSPNLSATIGPEKISLVGAYSDAMHTVLIFRALPATSALGITVWDDTGYFAPGPLRVWPDGYQSLEANAAPDSAKRSITHLTVAITGPFHPEASNIRPGDGDWNFSFDQQVRLSVTTLPVQTVILFGTERFTVNYFWLTPSVIWLDATVEGVPISSHFFPNWAVLTDPAGNTVEPFTGEAHGNAKGGRVGWVWARPDHATTLTLHIAGQGQEYTTTVSIPAPPTS